MQRSTLDADASRVQQNVGNTDPKPQADITPKQPKLGATGSANPVFKLPKLPKPTVGSPTAPKQPKVRDESLPRIVDLMPKLRGAQNAQAGTQTTADAGTGEQQGSPTSPGDGQQAAA